MTGISGDLRYAFRSAFKSPVFTTVAVLSLALGIGANTAMFTFLNQILLRLLPVKDARELTLLTMRGRHYGATWGGNALSYPMYKDFKEHNQVFTDMFCRYPRPMSVTYDGSTERVGGDLVSGTYFPVLGVTAAIGRTFTPDEDKTVSGHPVVVLSYDYWNSRFAADPHVLGKKILVDNISMTIIGVSQPGFDGVELGQTAKLFVPIMMQPDLMPLEKEFLTSRRTRWVNAFGRLKPGVTQTQAKASLQPFMHSMLEEEVKEPAFNKASVFARQEFLKCTIDLLPGSQGRSDFRGRLSKPLWVLMAITGMVLLIACANIANLLLARATGRKKEMAVRLALGARRGRIIRQLLTESLLLSLFGALVGVVLAIAADKVLLAAYLPSDTEGLKLATTPDLTVLLFTMGVTVLTSVLFGLAPALQATRPDVAPTLKGEASAVVSAGSAAMRKALVVAQVTLSLLLLIGAGLFLKSLSNLRNLGPGFSSERLIAFNIAPMLTGYDSARAKIFYRQLTDRLTAIPGVSSAGLAAIRILDGEEWEQPMTVEGYTPRKAADHAEPYMNSISPNYFATLGVPVIAGREFTLSDTGEVLHDKSPNPDEGWLPSKIIVNETFAKKYFAGRDPIGSHLGLGSDPGTKLDMEIIGVVKDMKYTTLRDQVPEQAYEPYLATRFAVNMTVYARTTLDPNQLFAALRAQVREMDPSVPVYEMRTMNEQITASLSAERLTASLSAAFGLLATLLAAIGLYGVMAYTVARRTREIGIRMALGAVQGNVVWMVMREVVTLVAIGVGVGVPLAFALMGLVKSQLYGLVPNDPSTMVLAAVGLSLVACLAGYFPAARASRVDPIKALRHE